MKKLFILAAVALLASCEEYKPRIQCTINGATVEIVETVNASYTPDGPYMTTIVTGNGVNYDVGVRFRNAGSQSLPGMYPCEDGVWEGLIEVYDGATVYSTNAPGGSGTIEVVQTGNNLIEGYFSATVSDGVNTLDVTDGLFSGRAF